MGGTVRPMSFLRAAESLEVRTIHTVAGKAWHRGEHYPKARLWVLESREAVLIVPDGPKAVRRIVEPLTATEWSGSRKLLTAVLPDGGGLRLDGKGCGCNMGMVGSAGPVEDGVSYHVVRTRTPEWHKVSK